jgi:histidinol phosphatase-like enzyme
MINQALEKYPTIDLSESFMVGDSAGDIGLAERFGMAAYGIGLPPSKISYAKGKLVSSLAEAVQDLKE